MQKSLFIEYVQRIFPRLGTIIEKINGKRNANLTYLHKSMMRTEYSADQKWESANVNTTYVAADVVAMDSPLPAKRRDSIASASGKLPKVGMKKILKESDLNAINIMKAQGDKYVQIANKLTADAVACAVGIDEKNEMSFLQALSDGVCLVEDEENVGTALRVTFGIPEKNKFGVASVGIATIDDIERVLSAADADGVAISRIAVSKTAYNKLRGTRGAKELVANYRGQTFDAETQLPTPPANVFDEAFADQYGGISFIKIDRQILIEKNGKRTPVKPFNQNKFTFLVDENVGALVWGTLAEATNRVNGVEYQVVDEYKLISKYSKTDPLQEFTAGQALCLPVLENCDMIYMLDSSEAQAVDEEFEEEDSDDAYIKVWGNIYGKSAFITTMNSVLGLSLAASTSDEAIIGEINKLSDRKEAKLKSAEAANIAPVIAVAEATKSVAASGSVEVTVTNAIGDVTVTKSGDAASSLNATYANNKVTIAASADAVSTKTADVTLTDASGRSATIKVTIS